MAIKCDFASAIGETVDQAYINVERFSGDKLAIKATVNVFISQAAREAEKKPIEQFVVRIPYDPDQGPIEAVYAYLKGLDQCKTNLADVIEEETVGTGGLVTPPQPAEQPAQ